ncbi:MAG TPA: hypothetical protein VI382_00600, partial [Candidatus Manganitrophaceae bacterium]|nr:hypothetical protein [Candidatus Manganitrophaceae bacterium]
MKRYRALLFDLCDTVMPFRNDRAPLARIRDKEVRTTTPLLYACFKEYNGHVPYEAFHDHFVEATENIAAVRAVRGEEISSSVRFDLLLDRLGAPLGGGRDELHRRLGRGRGLGEKGGEEERRDHKNNLGSHQADKTSLN